MAEPLTLIGFRYSVYSRIVRMALIEKALKARYVETDPFAETPDPLLARHTPFGRVPILCHGDFILTETHAILRYLDSVGAGASLIPSGARAAARMAQVIGIVDAYGYLPMVRQVFSHAVYRPRMGEPSDPARVVAGAKAARPVLAALDLIAAEGLQLDGNTLSLADLHLAPMMAYFAAAAEGADLLAAYPALARWWACRAGLPCLVATDPFVPR